MRTLTLLWRVLVWLWVSPNTLLGMIAGVAALATGGSCRLEAGVLEFQGGWLHYAFRRLLGGTALAMTLGHTILGPSRAAIDVARNHEHVHVRQYERWGPLFLPAYVMASLWAWLHGRRLYRDNFFEREAYGDCG